MFGGKCARILDYGILDSGVLDSGAVCLAGIFWRVLDAKQYHAKQAHHHARDVADDTECARIHKHHQKRAEDDVRCEPIQAKG